MSIIMSERLHEAMMPIGILVIYVYETNMSETGVIIPLMGGGGKRKSSFKSPVI